MSDSETPWTVAHQAPLSMGFSRQEYWSGLLCPGGYSQPRNQTWGTYGSCIVSGFFTTSATWEACVCVCVCMFVCVCVCVYIYVCVCVCVYIYMFVCVYIYICLCVCSLSEVKKKPFPNVNVLLKGYKSEPKGIFVLGRGQLDGCYM